MFAMYFVLAVGVAAPPGTHQTTGADMLRFCEGTGMSGKETDYRFIQCASYLDGLAEGVTIGSDAAEHGQSSCLPSVKVKELIAAFESSLKAHPEDMPKDVAVAASNALNRAYSCAKQK
jgi:hypothetical protein